MKKLRLLIFVVFLFIFVSSVNAEINMYTNSRDNYNLNEDVDLSVSVSSNENLRGFLKSNIECDNYDIDYYIIPVNLIADNIENFDIPSLNLFEDMLGTCKINIQLLDNNLNLVEEESSDDFIVTDELLLSFDLTRFEFFPGEKIVINGEVNYVIGQGVDEYSLSVYLDGEFIETLEKTSSIFKYNLELEEDIKSNSHELKIYVEDDYTNKKESFVEFFINPVPSKLRNKINNLEFLPGEEVVIETLLYDQADELMYSEAFLRIYDSNDDLVLGKETNTDESVSFTLKGDAVPGYYKIVTENEDFEIESEFTVLEVKDVSIYLDNGELYIKNIGNVKYKDEVFVDLGDINFIENVNLDVGEVKKILLVDDVEDGEYELSITANNENFDLGSVSIKDDRGIIEKVSNKITGNVVLTNGDMFSNGLVWVLIVLIVLIGLWYYLTFKRKDTKLKEIGVAEGKKTLEKIKAERAKNKFGVKRTNFANRPYKRREEKKDDSSEGGLFSMFD